MELNFSKIYRALLCDLGCGASTTQYILRRLDSEGPKFVTHILPKLSKSLLNSLELGYWSYEGTEFRMRKGLPRFLEGYLRDIFEYHVELRKWVVRPDPCPVAVMIIRQICDYTYKLSLPFNEEEIAEAIENFVRVDNEVPLEQYDRSFVDSLRKNFETFYAHARSLSLHDCARAARPGNGTYSGSRRDFFLENYMERTIPHHLRDLGFGLRLNKACPLPSLVDKDTSDYSEVLFVPKDSRGPRTIVREPYHALMFQLGFFDEFSKRLERDTCKRINFADQSINRQLAHYGSISGKVATLDLKEASDRVSYTIVRHILRYTPVRHVLQRLRTKCAKLPNGNIIPLRKLAGMGSGLTFPLMALVIHLAICTHVSKVRKIPFRHVMRQVYVYGDDIIVPVDWYDLSVAALSKVALSVNSQKSFRNGYFRESCGGDYFLGNDVTPVRLKLSSADIRLDGLNVTPSNSLWKNFSFIAVGIERHCRELVKSQLFNTAEYYYSLLEAFLGRLPAVSDRTNALGRMTPASYLTDPAGNYPNIKVWVPVPKKYESAFDEFCPYWHMRRTLSQVREGFLYTDRASPFGIASIPREIILRKKSVSAIDLTHIL